MASHIFYPHEEERKVSIREIVEAVDGTEYFINEEVTMDDYGYPVVTLYVNNPKYKDGDVSFDIFFQLYKDFDTPLDDYEVHFYSDDGFEFAKEIEGKLGINWKFISGSSHSDYLFLPDEELKERIDRFNNFVDEYKLKVRGERPVFIPSEPDEEIRDDYYGPSAYSTKDYEEIDNDSLPF